MPGRICAVSTCKSNQLTLKESGVSDVIFHSFPIAKDMVSTTFQKEWIRRWKRGVKFTLKNRFVCSKHFTENDNERDLENGLLGLSSRRKFKKKLQYLVLTNNYPTIDKEREVTEYKSQYQILTEKTMKLSVCYLNQIWIISSHPHLKVALLLIILYLLNLKLINKIYKENNRK
ncbi:uncharacterized protein [Leptinotarsa decemlineata]|uniref:uncharacterized protein n=1 Tax=Leptinotarsa decemlineata TaxID=7539 RepID=UPI003D30B4E6